MDACVYITSVYDARVSALYLCMDACVSPLYLCMDACVFIISVYGCWCIHTPVYGWLCILMFQSTINSPVIWSPSGNNADVVTLPLRDSVQIPCQCHEFAPVSVRLWTALLWSVELSAVLLAVAETDAESCVRQVSVSSRGPWWCLRHYVSLWWWPATTAVGNGNTFTGASTQTACVHTGTTDTVKMEDATK